MKRALIKWATAVLLLLASIFALSFLKNDEYVSEYVFARGVSREYLKAVSTLTSLLPFSLYEALATAAVVGAIVFLVGLIKRLKRKQYALAVKKILSVAALALCFILLYNATASFSYGRSPMSLEIGRQKPDAGQVYDAALYFMQDFNELGQSFERDGEGNIIPPYSFSKLSDVIREEFSRLDGDYFGPALKAKPMLYSKLMSYLGFSGIFMSITAEPNINADIPPSQLPLVMAHEMAHSAGVMREGDANLLSYFLLLSSRDGYLRYSAYMSTFGQMLTAVYHACGQQNMDELNAIYSPLIRKESSNNRQYWIRHENFTNTISDFLNDLYLKLSGVKSGTGSYTEPGEWEVIDTGEEDEEGNPIFEIYYSDIQYIYFDIYRKLSI
jgi:hypothetical protein